MFCTFVDDLKDWAARSKLTTDTVQALRTDGFTSLELIRLLTPDHITNIQKAHNLPYAQVLALLNAVKQLQEVSSAGHALNKSEYSENTLEKQPMFNRKQGQKITPTSLPVKGIVNLNFSQVIYFLTSLITNTFIYIVLYGIILNVLEFSKNIGTACIANSS